MNITLKNFSKSKPIQIVFSAMIFLAISPYLTLKHFNFLYSISIFIKDLLIFILPFSVFSYIASSLIQFKNKALGFIIILLIFEFISNSLSFFSAYGLYNLASVKTNSIIALENFNQLSAYVRISDYKPKYWAPDKTALLAVIMGFYLIYNRNLTLIKFFNRSRDCSNFIFAKIFSPLIPILIPGFIANFVYNKSLQQLISDSGINIFIMIIGVMIYILFLFYVGAKFNSQEFFRKITNALPSMLTAFATMCSIMTMPVTIKNAEKNLDNPDYARIIIPMTSNIQMVGDCFINGFLCLILMSKFNQYTPNFIEWSKFTFIFTLVRYAASGVSGGAIFLMLPLYEKYLNFNDEMSAIMLGLNVVLDPIVTATNVYANGALILIFEKLTQYIPYLEQIKLRTDAQ